MRYNIEYADKWIHVRFSGRIDAYDIIKQTGDEKYQAELLRLRHVIYDYSDAVDPMFNEETLKQFAALAKVLGELNGHVEVVAVPSDPNNLEKLEAYKKHADSDKWRITLARTPQEAIEVMQRICS